VTECDRNLSPPFHRHRDFLLPAQALPLHSEFKYMQYQVYIMEILWAPSGL
jgi:hypothetical protein